MFARKFSLSEPVSPFRRVWRTFGFLLLLLLSGCVGYVYLEGWAWHESIYMTIITLSTVGFKEVRPLTDAGRMFTAGLIVVGFGTVGYAFGNLAAFFVEGQARELVRSRKMGKIMASIRDHIIICGYGSEGHHAAEELERGGVKVVIIEKALDVVEKLQEGGKLAIHGDATHDDVLVSASVENASGLIAALHEDAENVFVVLTARGFNSDLTIVAKAADEATVAKLLRAGASKVISSAEIGGRRMASVLLRPKIVNFLDVITSDQELALRLEEIDVDDSSPFAGKSIRDLHIRSRVGVLVIAFHRKGQSIQINPAADTILRSGDVLIALGNDSQVEKLRDLAQQKLRVR